MPYVHKLTYISLIIRDYQVFLIALYINIMKDMVETDVNRIKIIIQFDDYDNKGN